MVIAGFPNTVFMSIFSLVYFVSFVFEFLLHRRLRRVDPLLHQLPVSPLIFIDLIQ